MLALIRPSGLWRLAEARPALARASFSDFCKKKEEKKSECREEKKKKKDKKNEGKKEKPKPVKLKRLMDLCGKVVMVTGGASGVGKATCKELVCKGAKVAIVDTDSKNGKSFAECINENMGCRASIFYKADVTNYKKLKEAFKETESKLGCVNVLFNNAGVFNDSPKGWSKEIDVNVKGVINGSLAALEFMGSQNGGPGGVVVNSASVKAFSKTSLMPIYRATKAAVISFTRSMGSEFHFKLNCVRFLALCPGFTKTNLFDKMEKKLIIPGSEMEELFCKRQKEFVFQKPETVASCVVAMIEYGPNGSAWLVRADQPPQLATIKDVKFSGVPVAFADKEKKDC